MDECRDGSHDCHGRHMQCLNRRGTYVCKCDEGYEKDQSGRLCVGKLLQCTQNVHMNMHVWEVHISHMFKPPPQRSFSIYVEYASFIKSI